MVWFKTDVLDSSIIFFVVVHHIQTKMHACLIFVCVVSFMDSLIILIILK
jgi:hypothetical protein